MSQAYVYPAQAEQDEAGSFVVSFRDVPEALTDGETLQEALAEAEDALMVALGDYVDDARRPRPLPKASRRRAGEHAIVVPPLIAAKLALHQAMRDAGLNGAQLARRMGVPETAARRLLSLGHRSHVDQVDAALRLLGRRVELKVLEMV